MTRPSEQPAVGGRRLPPLTSVPPYVAAFIMREIPSARWRAVIDAARLTNPKLAVQYEQTVAYLRDGRAWWLAEIETAGSDSGTTEVELAEPTEDLKRASSLDTTEVGRQLGVSPRWVVDLIKSEALSADRVGKRSWSIDPDSLEAYKMRNKT